MKSVQISATFILANEHIIKSYRLGKDQRLLVAYFQLRITTASARVGMRRRLPNSMQTVPTLCSSRRKTFLRRERQKVMNTLKSASILNAVHIVDHVSRGPQKDLADHGGT